MQAVTTIGLDIAKSVFQVHGVDARGNVVVRRQLRRRQVLPFFKKLPSCLVGVEACATSHHWSRRAAGSRSHCAPDAAGLREALPQASEERCRRCRSDLRRRSRGRACGSLTTKTPEQQSCLMLHRTRHLFIRQQTAVINAIRAHLAEFGIVAPVGRNGVEELLDVVADPDDDRVPEVARECLAALGAQLRVLKVQVLEFDRRIMAWHRSNETSKRLDEIPGRRTCAGNRAGGQRCRSKGFRSGRDFSAWVGLVPKQNSSGGKEKLGSITKRGDRYLRSLFTAGALAVIRYAKIHGTNIGLGSLRCWRGDRRRWQPSRSPTRSRAWPGR